MRRNSPDFQISPPQNLEIQHNIKQGLDGLNRTLVKHFIDQLVRNSQTQLLFVSHQIEDAPDCITHIFEFVAEREGYRYVQTAV